MLPKGIVSDGFPSTREVCGRIGIVFDPWQRDLNRCLLSNARGGLYAADTVLLSIPRQVGKTFDVGGVVFADSIKNPGTTTVWTAHRFKVARETFNEQRGWAKLPLLAPHIDYDAITTAAGNECIPFRNGSRIVFAARERGSVRGFSKVRRLVLDEGQILTELALADLVPTMNQAVNPQIILMCTPPKPSDPSEVVTRLREDALSGASTGVLYVEMSAPPDSDPADRAAWRKANPSYPKRTPAKAILRMRKLLSSEDFLREALGIWDSAAGHVIDPAAWAMRADPGSQAVDPVAIGLAISGDLAWSSIAVGGRRADGLGHGELVEHRPGTAWLVGRAVELAAKWNPCAVVLNPSKMAASVEKELLERGLKTKPAPGERRLHIVGGREYASACVALAKDVQEGSWRHLGQPELDAAVRDSVKRKLADLWAFTGRDADTVISPLEAVTLARHGFMTHGMSSAFFGSWR